MYEFACMKESACDGCTLPDAQNMTGAVWQQAHIRFYKTLDPMLLTSVKK